MLEEKVPDIGFALRGEYVNNAIIFYPQKSPTLFFELNQYFRAGNKKKTIKIENPRINLFSYLKRNERGLEFQEIIKRELEINLPEKEFREVLTSTSIILLSKTEKIHLKALDMEVNLTGNEYFLDIGVLPEEQRDGFGGRCLFFNLGIVGKNNSDYRKLKFASILYKKCVEKIEELVVKGHEETHALCHLDRLELFKQELDKYEKIDFSNFSDEKIANLGSGLAVKKRFPEKNFSILWVAESLENKS